MKRTLFLILVAIMTLSVAAKPKRALTEKDMGAYLFTFFSDPTHGLFMAISYDGYTFTAVILLPFIMHPFIEMALQWLLNGAMPPSLRNVF